MKISSTSSLNASLHESWQSWQKCGKIFGPRPFLFDTSTSLSFGDQRQSATRFWQFPKVITKIHNVTAATIHIYTPTNQNMTWNDAEYTGWSDILTFWMKCKKIHAHTHTIQTKTHKFVGKEENRADDMPLLFSIYTVALQFTTHSSHNLKLISYSVTQIATKILLDSSRTVWREINLHDHCCCCTVGRRLKTNETLKQNPIYLHCFGTETEMDIWKHQQIKL